MVASVLIAALKNKNKNNEVIIMFKNNMTLLFKKVLKIFVITVFLSLGANSCFAWFWSPQPVDPIIEVKATGWPIFDVYNIRNAIEEAENSSGTPIIRLKGKFKLGNCQLRLVGCFIIKNRVIIEGVGDPTVTPQDESSLTIVEGGGTFPFTILQTGEGSVIVRNLWFRGQKLGSLGVFNLDDTVEVLNNRFTDISPVFVGFDLRLAFGLGGIATPNFIPPNVLDNTVGGVFRAVGNYINLDERQYSGPHYFEFGDDNGIAAAACNADLVEISNNTIISRGEAIEIEGCKANDKAVFLVENNTISMDAIESILGLVVSNDTIGQSAGGHPAAIKLSGSNAAFSSIKGNNITTTGNSAGVCIMISNVNPNSSGHIENNYCEMEGQFSGIQVGWIGSAFLYEPAGAVNLNIENNYFSGRSVVGIDFLNLQTNIFPTEDLVNKSTGNRVLNNDFSDLTTDIADVIFDSLTLDNQYSVNSDVIDFGDNNIMSP